MPKGSSSCLELPIGGLRAGKHNARPDVPPRAVSPKVACPDPGARGIWMFSYLLRRIWQMVPTLAGVILLVFFLFKYFGGDPAEILGGLQASPKQIESIRTQLGLNRPVLEQLWIFVQQVATFNWGRSWATNEAVNHIFTSRLPATLTIMIPILILDVVLAIVAGMA